MIVRKLAQYIAAQRETALINDVHHAARRCLVDFMAAAVPGGRQPPSTMLAAALIDESLYSVEDIGIAQLIPDGGGCPPTVAAFINGAAAHVMEFDDIYRDGLYHPGAPVISAALAVCQARRLSGEQLLRAVVAGYEISNRLATAVNPAHYRYWHTTATIGAIGAATAASCALSLNEVQTTHALANACTLAAGLQQAFRSDAMSKPLHVGRAAENGVMVALAAEQGVTGAKDMFTGDVGLINAMSDGPDLDEIMQDLGETFTIINMTQKNHGCCGHIFATLDAVMALQKLHRFDAGDVDKIQVRSYQAALDITGRTRVTSASEGRFSTPWCVACAVILGGVRLNAFSDETLRREDIQALANRVTLSLDEEIQSTFPRKRQSRVEITLKSGEVLSHYAKTRKGDPDNPLTDDELNEKFDELVVPILGDAKAAKLREKMWCLHEGNALMRVFCDGD